VTSLLWVVVAVVGVGGAVGGSRVLGGAEGGDEDGGAASRGGRVNPLGVGVGERGNPPRPRQVPYA
jgi:hypothetical protein